LSDVAHVFHLIGQGLLMAAGMAWKTGWSLVLGFALSAVLQVVVSADRLKDALGTDGPKPVALAALAGAASSSCSYASAAIMRTLFKKGAALGPSLAFLVASTNLVLELGIILWLLMGWRFMLAEWIGGVVMIAILVPIVHLCVPRRMIDAARSHEESGHSHDHGAMTVEGETWRDRLRDPEALPRIARAFAMDWRMLWKDLLAGFLIGGMLAAFVPDGFWQALFLDGAPAAIRIPADVVIGPVVAMLTFVCSIGNVPLAAMLWAGGASFGGVIAFLYADLIVLPLIDAYRRYFGWRMALAIAAILFVSMALAALVISLGFGAFGLVPAAGGPIRAELARFRIDYSFWLNLVAIGVAVWLFWTARRNPTHCH
jgi:uncharacterized protein